MAVERAENSELIAVLHRIDLTLQIPAESFGFIYYYYYYHLWLLYSLH